MRAGVIIFPGSNCDRDVAEAISRVTHAPVSMVWHEDRTLPNLDLVVLPGGFSYGDYLRCGAIAARAPIMDAVRTHAAQGRLVLGICNGFQILCESQLLPGALLANRSLRFICRTVQVRVENVSLPFTRGYQAGQVITMPIAHGEGNYFIDHHGLEKLEQNQQVIFRYCDNDGAVTPASNPNGSLANIAGISNLGGTVLGLMPHPERAIETMLGSSDGASLFSSALNRMAA